MDVRRAILLVAAFGSACTFAGAQGTWRVSVDSSGIQGNGHSDWASISADGRFVAFESDATNLVSGDTNGWVDVFVHDRQTGATTRVSVDSSGGQGNDTSYLPSISADGRFVAFGSLARNLVPGDTNGYTDVFVHDRQIGTTTLVSVDSSGGQGNDTSYDPSISADGRLVAFASYATNLVPGDTNRRLDVFVHDQKSGTTTQVSVDSSGGQGNNHSYVPSISADGRFVAFDSYATNLVPGDTNSKLDVFVHDQKSGTTTRVSVDSSGVEGNGFSTQASISADGGLVAFWSVATNLVQGDTNFAPDVFVHSLQTGTTRRMSVDSSGNQGNHDSLSPTISGTGRFVAFISRATYLVPGDTNNAADVFVRDRMTRTTVRVSVDSSGNQGNLNCNHPSICTDGRFVAFESQATNLVPGDTNGVYDVFVHGPYLTLEASPETVSAGATIAFTTWKGLAGGCVLLTMVDINGTPMWGVAIDTFDVDGLWTLSGTVPPGLSGNVVTYLSVGFAPTGELQLTNLETVTFQ